ncbi:MAG: hypothetical protein F6K22_36460 [Okeania sp. SIO2F4]|uniref:hypothetical protein n=1 Tax=Okeania sp. SIO2F4 TaxID=2607790 RepID=UPI00142A1FB9|nr:hypothetical protein [Okeania sp. SIO2F4]NES07804.1 hypothetical protein [Okeania sp. SIO2F4]
MEMETRQMFDLPGWDVQLGCGVIRLCSPDSSEAAFLAKGAKAKLHKISERMGTLIEILTPEGRILASFGQPSKPKAPEPQPQISSYAASRIDPTADSEAVLDFVKGKKAEGLIVTVTGMHSDKCLLVNDLQALDRGGGWTAQDWIGIDFKKLWHDSFLVGKTNYYGQLVEAVERDRYLPNFFDHIRRPSGALAEYSSSYHYVDNFLGAPVRIAVSTPGDWRIIESAPDKSE